MATIYISSIDKLIQTNPATSILNALLKEGVFINHLCGGKAHCGTCQIRILKGQKTLNPIGEREGLKLKKVKAPANIRLACQTYTYGDIEIAVRFEKKLSNY